MKLITLILFIGIMTASFGQSKPDQKLLSKDYLRGKSPSELRIMRNEIFARYGYIFKSEDLRDYFTSKKWYKPTSDNVNGLLTEIDKKNIELIAEFEKNEANEFTSVVYDSAIAKSMKVIHSNSSPTFIRQIEVTYPSYNWKKTVERISYGADKEPTIITIEYVNDSPYNSSQLPYWEMTKYVDDIKIEYNYLHVIDYGTVDDYNEFYPFFSDEPILCFDGNNCFRFKIPNSKIPDFWIGYSYSKGKNEKIGAKIYLSDINGIINELSIISKSGKTGYLEDDHFKIITKSPRDKIDNSRWNTYELWSSEKATNRTEINDFKIEIDGVFKIEIPIINGYLFGKSDRIQTMTVE